MNVNRPVIPKDNNMDELTRSILGGTAITASTSGRAAYMFCLKKFFFVYIWVPNFGLSNGLQPERMHIFRHGFF